MKNVDVFLISISNPILIGIYENQSLIEKKEIQGRASEILPEVFEQLLDEYNIQKIFFINGPGSFMAIKVSYVFCKTLSITKDIELFASDGFAYNDLGLIKAHRNLFFIKENGKISTIKVDDAKESKFFLPNHLDYKLFSDKINPNYILPAV